MAHRHYLVHGNEKQLRRLAKGITSAIGNEAGEPLAPIGAARALVTAGVALQLAAARPGRDVQEQLRDMGADSRELRPHGGGLPHRANDRGGPCSTGGGAPPVCSSQLAR